MIEKSTAFALTWGFVKYFHPAINVGLVDADELFFRNVGLMTRGLITPTFEAKLCNLIDHLDKLNYGHPGKRGPLPVAITEVLDEASPLFKSIESVWKRRDKITKHVRAGVSKVPEFIEHDETDKTSLPLAKARKLALARIYAAISFILPHRELVNSPSDLVINHLDAMVNAKSIRAYNLALLKIASDICDGHCFLQGTGKFPIPGRKRIPFELRIMNSDVIVSKSHSDNFQIGDKVISINCQSVEDKIAYISQYISASTEQAKNREVARLLPRISSKKVIVEIERKGQTMIIETSPRKLPSPIWNHTLDGEDLQSIDNVYYLKFTGLKRDVDWRSILSPQDTHLGLIIDLRCYPTWGFREITRHFGTGSPRGFAKLGGFNSTIPRNMRWSKTKKINMRSPVFDKNVAVLIDETSQSHSEYFAMVLKSSSNVRSFGENTAGSNGNMTSLPLPGGLTMKFTGLDVRWADMSKTQGIGVKPDVEIITKRSHILQNEDPVFNMAKSWILAMKTNNISGIKIV